MDVNKEKLIRFLRNIDEEAKDQAIKILMLEGVKGRVIVNTAIEEFCLMFPEFRGEY